MTRIVTGDLFTTKVEGVVNPVNCVGIMGKGLALVFDRRFPGNSQVYRQACAEGRLRAGGLIPYEVLTPWRFIINLATKDHWRHKSRLQDIATGLVNLRNFAADNKLKSAAIPAIGCGNGGLDWQAVLRLIEQELGPSDCDFLVFGPK